MDPLLRRSIGSTSLEVTQLGMGGASLGDMRESIPEAQATAALEAALAAGIGYFDTSPWYGNGKSELRFGHVLRTKPRNSFALSTKVGRVHRRPAEPDTYKHPRWAGGLPFEPQAALTGLADVLVGQRRWILRIRRPKIGVLAVGRGQRKACGSNDQEHVHPIAVGRGHQPRTKGRCVLEIRHA